MVFGFFFQNKRLLEGTRHTEMNFVTTLGEYFFLRGKHSVQTSDERLLIPPKIVPLKYSTGHPKCSFDQSNE